MRFSKVLCLLSGVGVTLLLSACSSNSDKHGKEFYTGHSARTVSQIQNPSTSLVPSIGYTQGHAVQIRSQLANLPCETLAYEDKRISNFSQIDSPTYEDMMEQLKLLEIRAALYARCQQPSHGVNQTPQFTVPIQEAMSAEQIEELRRLKRLKDPSNQIVSVAPAIKIPSVTDSSKDHIQVSPPPIVRIAKAIPPQASFTSTTTSQSNEIKIIGQQTTPTLESSNGSEAKYRTIEKFGDTVRVKSVSFDELPLIAGPELTAK